MDISNQMLEAVANAKKQAKSAERKFDNAAEMISLGSSSRIDLFGNRACSQVADIASSVRRACDELYASYQSLVLMLDQQCRPLLSQGPSTRAVKEVMEMIRWLNSESEIGSNFSGSLNGVSLGDLVSVKYFASMECQVIQKHWENSYSAMPGIEEENRAYNQRRSEELRAEREAELNAKREMRMAEQRQREREHQEKEQAQKMRLDRMSAKLEETQRIREYLKQAQAMLGGSFYAFACVKADGTAEAFHHYSDRTGGAPGDVSTFADIKAIVCTEDGIVGLRKNGSCIATNPGKQCYSNIMEANQWHGISALATGEHHVVGLKDDGSCVANSIKKNVIYSDEGQCNVMGWTDVEAIACGGEFTVGLKKDGSIVYTGNKCAESAAYWKDIVLISAGGNGVIGVTKAGELKVAGKLNTAAMEAAENIVQLEIANGYAYALQSDGTVLGGKRSRCASNPTTIVAKNVLAMAGGDGLLLLKEDGTLELKYSNYMEIPADIKLFDDYKNYRQEIASYEEARQQKARQILAYRQAGVCQHCGGAFKKSFFSCKCSQCGVEKDY